MDQSQAIIENLNSIINEKNKTITQQAMDIQSLTVQVSTIKDQFNIAQEQALKVPNLMALFQQAEKSKSLALAAQETQNRTIAQLRNTSYTTVKLSNILIYKLQTFLDKFVTKRK